MDSLRTFVLIVKSEEFYPTILFFVLYRFIVDDQLIYAVSHLPYSQDKPITTELSLIS